MKHEDMPQGWEPAETGQIEIPPSLHRFDFERNEDPQTGNLGLYGSGNETCSLVEHLLDLLWTLLGMGDCMAFSYLVLGDETPDAQQNLYVKNSKRDATSATFPICQLPSKS